MGGENGGHKTAECYDKEISAAVIERRWKYGRSGGGGGYRNAEDLGYGAGIDGSWDDGTEIGDGQVGE